MFQCITCCSTAFHSVPFSGMFLDYIECISVMAYRLHAKSMVNENHLMMVLWYCETWLGTSLCDKRCFCVCYYLRQGCCVFAGVYLSVC